MKRPWTADVLLPAGAALTLCSVVTTEKGLIIEAAGPASARCPRCHQPSHTRHSRYWRTLRDVATHGQFVTLRVQVSRWRCRNLRCDTAIFADRLPGVAMPRAQHTERLGTVVHLVGHALGGRAGERLLRRLGMVVSADSVVRAVTHGAPSSPADPAIRVVGIDDWAWQKGQQHFGTILVDLERRRVVDVLAVRTADGVGA